METGALSHAAASFSSSLGGQGPDATTRAAVTGLVVLDEIDSTNAEARRRAETGETGPLWIAARRQTAGRGRRGRAWETAPGNLAATLLTITSKPAAEAAQIAFVAALAVSDLAASYTAPSGVAVKWPNDVMIAGRKAAGILVESGLSRAGGLWLAIGIGVNLAKSPTAAERPATCFAEHLADGRQPPAPEAALAGLASGFATWRALWDSQGFGPVAEAWTARAYGLGRPCVARLEKQEVEGIAEGLDVDGAFRLRLADGSIRRILAGDVFFADDANAGRSAQANAGSGAAGAA